MKKVKNNKLIFLKGNKIYLKPFEINDVTNIYQKNLNNVSESGIKTNFPRTKFELKKYYKDHKINKNSIFFTVSDLKNNQAVGTTSISQISWVNRNATYGRLIFEEFRGLGYGTETLKLIKKYSFNFINLRSLWTMVYAENFGSIKSNIKNGGKIIGSLKKHVYKNKKYQDSVIIQHLKYKN